MALKNYDFATIKNAPYLEVNHPPPKKNPENLGRQMIHLS